MYAAAGVDPADSPLVGIGSVCRHRAPPRCRPSCRRCCAAIPACQCTYSEPRHPGWPATGIRSSPPTASAGATRPEGPGHWPAISTDPAPNAVGTRCSGAGASWPPRQPGSCRVSGRPRDHRPTPSPHFRHVYPTGSQPFPTSNTVAAKEMTAKPAPSFLVAPIMRRFRALHARPSAGAYRLGNLSQKLALARGKLSIRNLALRARTAIITPARTR